MSSDRIGGTHHLVRVSSVDFLRAHHPLLHPRVGRDALRDPRLLHASSDDQADALAVQYGVREDVRDVVLHHGGVLADGELDRGQRRLALDAKGGLHIDAVEDAEVVVGEEGDGELGDVEREERDVFVAEDVLGEELAAAVRVSALPLRVELDHEGLRAGGDDEAGEGTAVAGSRRVDRREADATRGRTGFEEVLEDLLGECGLDEVVLDLHIGIVGVDEGLLNDANLRWHSCC